MWRFAAVLVLVSTAVSAQNNYFAGGTRTLSAFVKAEFLVWKPGEIELLVLWRGSTPRWHSGSGSSRGSGTAQGYRASIQFGPQQFDFLYDRARRVVQIRSVEVALTQGENVLLVDGADRDGAPSIKAVRGDLRYPVVAGRGAAPASPAAADVITMVDRSLDIVTFLRCNDPANDQLPARASGYICANLKSR